MAGTDSFDDDFGDFGGFEAAENVVASGTVSNPSHAEVPDWIAAAAPTPVIPVDVSQQNPSQTNAASGGDTLSQTPQNQSSGTDHAHPQGSSDIPTNSDQSQRLPNLDEPASGATNWAALGDDLDLKEGSETSGASGSNAPMFEANFDLVEGTAAKQSQDSWMNSALNEQKTSSSTDVRESASKGNKLVTSGFLDDDLDEQLDPTSTKADDLELDEVKPSKSEKSSEDLAKKELEAAKEREQLSIVTKTLEEVKEHNRLLESAKETLQKELDDLSKEHKLQISRTDVLEKRLREEQEKCEEMQIKHSTDLSEMRESGQKALAIIIEEYKETCKLAVLQQQQDCLKLLNTVLAEEIANFKGDLAKQEENFRKEFSVLQKQLEEKTEKNLELQRENAKLKWEEGLENISKETKSLVSEEVEKEQQKCKENIDELLADEKKQHKEELERLKAQTKEDISSYIKDHRQKESNVRNRLLSSTDLFLEGARQQINILLRSDDLGSKTETTDEKS